MGDLFGDYSVGEAWDEMFVGPDQPRTPYILLYEQLRALTESDFDDRCEARDRSFRDRGITFSLSGEERPFPLDLVPRIIAADEWRTIESGVTQRVLALEAFLADVYGMGRIFDAGVVPRGLVTTSEHFHRETMGVEPANGVRIHVAGIDLVRCPDGRFAVLEDNVRTPSGISYVVENRRAMTQVFPELFAAHRAAPVDGYPAKLLEALRAAAPAGVTDPTVVLLTPGVYNAAYFEHSFLARQMGVELVEGRDLVCRNGQVLMRTTAGERPVHVVYRRVDDDFLDPLHFRPDSVLGCAGILNAARAGKVTIANAVGNGVADDKAIYAFVPDMIRFYLDEEPVLRTVETLRLERPDHLALALDRLDELVSKPVDGSGGHGLVIGPQATAAELDALRTAILEEPRRWVAQEVVALSTSPTQVGGRLEPRHIDLRPFAVNDGERIWVVPGGLTRVALPRGSLVVNSSQGGGSKDTWVLSGGLPPPPSKPAATPQAAPVSAPPVLGPVGEQPAQQQQQGGHPC
ncbi:MAG: circularly permuted type 2 ATP-grasp protein [Acidimicrobiales bacterium]